MPRVIHFEICADHPERAVNFYRDVFGWESRKWDGPLETWLLLTGGDDEPGINGALVHREASATGRPANLIDVASLDAALLRISQAGGEVLRSRTPISGLGFVAYCRDTEGTTSPSSSSTSRHPDGGLCFVRP